MGRTPKEKESYYIYCDGRWVECTEEVYRVYYQGKRSAKYQEEKDKKNGKVTFSEIEAERKLNMVDTLADDSIDIERQVSSDLLMQTLKRVFTEKEYEIIEGLYIQGRSLHDLAAELGINVNAVRKRRDRLYPKLKKFLEKYYE